MKIGKIDGLWGICPEFVIRPKCDDCNAWLEVFLNRAISACFNVVVELIDRYTLNPRAEPPGYEFPLIDIKGN